MGDSTPSLTPSPNIHTYKYLSNVVISVTLYIYAPFNRKSMGGVKKNNNFDKNGRETVLIIVKK
jgi:hypothetical protein